MTESDYLQVFELLPILKEKELSMDSFEKEVIPKVVEKDELDESELVERWHALKDSDQQSKKAEDDSSENKTAESKESLKFDLNDIEDFQKTWFTKEKKEKDEGEEGSQGSE